MPETTPLSKRAFPEDLRFDRLRAAGIAHLERLGTEIWTDFNVHDPGITTLEVLAYALTDLAYRTRLPVEDLLARPEGTEEDNFFTPREILTCNPVTLLDLRKLLVDIPGVRNAWVVPAREGEVPLHVDPERCELRFDPPETGEGASRLELGGLYAVHLELIPSSERDACGRPITDEEAVLQRVWAVLDRHRNLAEDVVEVVVLEEERVGLCADLELLPEADAEEVLLAVYQAVEAVIRPPIRFYTLEEMLERGGSIESIYAGRPLRGESSGFVDPEELAASERAPSIFTSDLYRVILDVDGVEAVENLVLTSTVNGIPTTRGEPWCLNLTPRHRPVLDLEASVVSMTKDGLPFGVDAEAVRREYRERHSAGRKAVLDPYELDRAVPEGRLRDLADHRSVVHDFPGVYGVGAYGPDLSGLEGTDRLVRRAQSRQLRGYLLFFDQILAGYLAQLAHLRALFAMRPDTHPTREGLRRTYFSQVPDDLTGLDELLEREMPEYAEVVEALTEDPETYVRRRGRFLDHLLARFAESFTEYVLLMYRTSGARRSDERLNDDKARFLEAYPSISRDRGRGFDARPGADGVWNTANVTGLQQRAARLVGIEDVRRRTLAHVEVRERAGQYRFRVVADGEVLAVSVRSYPSREEAESAFQVARTAGREDGAYRGLAVSREETTYEFEGLEPDGRRLIAAPRGYETRAEREAARLRLVAALRHPDITCRTVRTSDCHRPVVLAPPAFPRPGTGSSGGQPVPWRLLLGERARPTRTGARADGRDVLLALAGDPSAYRPVGSEGNFGFELVDPDSGATRGRHPGRYRSAPEREDRMRTAALLMGTGARAEHRLSGTPGSFEFEIQDPDGTSVLEGRDDHPTGARAEAAAELVLRYARHRVYYRRTETVDEEGTETYGFELLGPGDRVRADHPITYENPGDRDAAMDALVEEARREPDTGLVAQVDGTAGTLSVEIRLEWGGSVETLLVSADTYPDRGAADLAAREIIELAADRRYYRVEEDGSFTVRRAGPEGAPGPVVAVDGRSRVYQSDADREAAIDLVRAAVRETDPAVSTDNVGGAFFIQWLDETGAVRREGSEDYGTREAAEEAARRTVADGTAPSSAYRIQGVSCGFEFLQRIGPHPFRSTGRFGSSERAARACLRAADRWADLVVEAGEEGSGEGAADEPAARTGVLSSEGGLLRLLDPEGRALAGYHGPARTEEAIETVVSEVIAELAGSSEVPVEFERRPSGFAVRLADPDTGGVLLEDSTVQSPAIALSPEPLFRSASARDRAVAHLSARFEREAPEPVLERRGDAVHFRLDGLDRSLLISASGYPTERAARDAFERVRAVGAERTHFRPFAEGEGEETRYGFELYDGSMREAAREAACRRASRWAEKGQNENAFAHLDAEDGGWHGYRLHGEEERLLGASPTGWPTDEDRDARIARIEDLLDVEGLHVLEHVLLRPRSRGAESTIAGEAHLVPALLPLDGTCLDEDGRIDPIRSDPYSYRATVVLPYWPERFRDESFRRHLERALRREAPAHVFLRICWLDPCRMRAFETAFRTWLGHRADDSGERPPRPQGMVNCEEIEATNHLVDVLCGLRSVYPEARLDPCDVGPAGSPLVLDQTQLGSATPDRDDSL